MPAISVIVIAYNEVDTISRSIEAILKQTLEDFELIVVDDGSEDHTSTAVNKFNDKRIKLIRNKENSGVSRARNIGLMSVTGNHVFFTDADCIPDSNWLKEGITFLETHECIGVEGRTLYEISCPTLSDRYFEILEGNQYCCCNMAYRRDVLEKVGGFRDRYNHALEDRDLAFRVMKKGHVLFNSSMLVYHQHVKWTIKTLLNNAKRAKYTIRFVKEYNDRSALVWRIALPRLLLDAIFPMILFRYRIRGLDDIIMLPVLYLRAALTRLYIWKTAIEERIFIL